VSLGIRLLPTTISRSTSTTLYPSIYRPCTIDIWTSFTSSKGVEFEWDEEKARSNVANHSVTFAEAAEVFFDPFYQGGDAVTEDEAHEFIIGYSLAPRLLLIVSVDRGNGYGSFRRVRRRVLRESSMKKPEGERPLQVRPRETEVISLAIPKDTLVEPGRNTPSLYAVNGRPVYVHLNGLAIVRLK
jgi:uncharacterized DUF497 family protein